MVLFKTWGQNPLQQAVEKNTPTSLVSTPRENI